MADAFSKVDWVCMETLRLLKNKLTVVSYFTTSYEKDFRQDFAVGDTVRVKMPWRPLITDGFDYVEQPLDRIETTITVDQPFHTGFAWDTVDKLLNMERGEEKVSKEYCDPVATYFAAEWDKRAAAFAYKNTNGIVGVLGTNPTTFDATSAACRQRMIELACPDDGDKAILVPPSVMRAVKGGNLTNFNPSSEISRMYKQGVVGMADGFEWFDSMSLKSHTAGTWAGAVTLSSAVANGATSIAVTCTTGDTFLEGDVIGYGSVYPVNPVTRERTQSATTYTSVVAQSVTGAASAATVQIQHPIYYTGPYQNVDAQPANGATLTLFPGTTSPNGKSGKQGLAIHKLGFAFVNLPLPMPKKEEINSQQTDPDTGISLSFIRSFDPLKRRWINRFDTLGGFGKLHSEPCSVRILSA